MVLAAYGIFSFIFQSMLTVNYSLDKTADATTSANALDTSADAELSRPRFCVCVVSDAPVLWSSSAVGTNKL